LKPARYLADLFESAHGYKIPLSCSETSSPRR
jgi:hypothetical protein